MLAVLAAVLTASAADARDVGTGRGWRSTRYGRQGAEIWIEFPRYVNASGGIHVENLDIEPALGYGFGLMWGISDNIAFEARMLQSDHPSTFDDGQWDVNLLQVGPRFTFMTENKLQPFFGAGWSKMTFERDSTYYEGTFERYTGYAWYATAGLDYIHSSAWSVFVRGDYTKGGYGYVSLGFEGESLDPPRSAECVSATVGLSYRIPAW